MKAIRKLEPGKGFVEIQELEEPKAGRNEVKIKVEAAGICGTDIKILHGEAWSNPPVTLGHELSGVVCEVGLDVSSIAIGDRVVCETAQKICGECYFCKTGNYLMCKKRLSIGYGVDGGMAQFITVRKEIVHKLPDTVSLDEGALIEPCAVACHAVCDSVKILPTDCILVTGAGAIGLLVAQIAKCFGAKVIITGLSIDAPRLALAKELGVDITVNVQNDNLEDYIPQSGIDLVFECTGVASSISNAMSYLKNMGKLVQVGLTKPNLEIPYSLLTGKEISLIGTFGHKWQSWESAIALIAQKKINVEKLITHRFPMSEWEQAFETAEKMEGIKVLIYPNKY